MARSLYQKTERPFSPSQPVKTGDVRTEMTSEEQNAATETQRMIDVSEPADVESSLDFLGPKAVEQIISGGEPRAIRREAGSNRPGGSRDSERIGHAVELPGQPAAAVRRRPAKATGRGEGAVGERGERTQGGEHRPVKQRFPAQDMSKFHDVHS